MKQLKNNVYGVLTFGGLLNGYVIDHADGLVVVDTGFLPSYVNQLAAGLKEKNWTLADVKHILITHFHSDHTGGLPELQRRTNAQTYAHKADAAVIRGEQAPRYANPNDVGAISRLLLPLIRQQKLAVARVDVDLEDNAEILPGLRAVHLPGHSDGQVGFWLEQGRILIGGDVAMRMTGSLTMPFRLPSSDWNAVKQSIRKAANLNPDVLGMGHGQPLVGDAAAHLRQLADRIGA
jgi:glyoxylase-like metal-dependent hydrolase (beta-lactamase superfamily II)